MQLRKKAERFVFTKAGEKISGPAVMQYLGKAIPSCYVSGEAVNVTPAPIPFDMNTDNMLPSNMAYMGERFFKGDPLTMALVFSEIQVKNFYTITLSFLSPGYATKKVLTHGRELLEKLTKLEEEEFDYELAYGIWDKLMFEGLKGMNILRITNDAGVTLSIDAPLANQYFLTKTAIRAQAFQATGPVAQPNGGLNLIK